MLDNSYSLFGISRTLTTVAREITMFKPLSLLIYIFFPLQECVITPVVRPMQNVLSINIPAYQDANVPLHIIMKDAVRKLVYLHTVC